MLAASFTNLGGILSGPVAFFKFKDIMIMLMSLGLALGKLKYILNINNIFLTYNFLNIIGVVLMIIEIP